MGVLDQQFEESVCKLSLVAGAFVRGQFRRWLKRQAHIQEKMDISFEESKGWMESEFYIMVEGPIVLVDGWCSATLDKFREIE